MMQTFRISDALRCVILNTPKGPNLACAGHSAASHSSIQNLRLWKQALAERDNRITLACWNGLHLGGLVSARTRAGNKVWEIDHFYLPGQVPGHQYNGNGLSDFEETAALELLDQVVQLVGQRSAERVFFRLPSSNPAIFLARRSGFFPYCEGTRLESPTGSQSLGDDAMPMNGFRVRQKHDEYPLFQLFSAATPMPVREALGLTYDQWYDAQEPCDKGRQDWLKEHGGRLVGWLSLLPRGRVTEARAMARPEYPDLLSQLVEFALSNPGVQSWLVPDYQQSVCELLRYRGFQEMARYSMLIKRVAAPALRPGLAPVEA